MGKRHLILDITKCLETFDLVPALRAIKILTGHTMPNPIQSFSSVPAITVLGEGEYSDLSDNWGGCHCVGDRRQRVVDL